MGFCCSFFSSFLLLVSLVKIRDDDDDDAVYPLHSYVYRTSSYSSVSRHRSLAQWYLPRPREYVSNDLET